jgi:colanic acid/amylovoran biosynthesis protein
MKILITNTVPLNGGDAAILVSIVKMLKERFGEAAELVVYGAQPEVAGRYYPDLDFRPALWSRIKVKRGLFRKTRQRMRMNRMRRALGYCQSGREAEAVRLVGEATCRDLNTYLTADLIVSTGGTYLVEYYNLSSRLFDYEVSLAGGALLVFFTQSMGPFEKAETRESFAQVFDRAALILLRDERSRGHLEELGISGPKVVVSADAVFAMAEDTVLDEAMKRADTASSPLKVAISVRSWSHFKGMDKKTGMKRYLAAVGGLVSHLVTEQGAEVRFLSTCQGIEAYWNDDSLVARQVVGALDAAVAEKVTIDDGFHSPEALIETLKKEDVVVATRMHMSILSLVSGTPVFPIAYEFKTESLFTRLGLGDYVQQIEQLEAASLCEAFDLFVERLPQIRPNLFAGVQAEKVRALDAMERVGELMGVSNENRVGRS